MTENYEQEKAIYIQRLGAQIETIQKILDTNTLDLIDASHEEKLRKLKAEAERYKKKLEKNEFEIAIVGLEKAGKSTFANAMMGYDILPSDEKRCTYTSTKIKSGNNSGNVKFFSRDEFNENFRENLKAMKIENADSYSFESLNKGSYEGMFEKLDDTTKKAYGDNINEDIKTILDNKNTISGYLNHADQQFDSSTITTVDFKRFIKDPEYALAVKEVSILSSELSGMPNAVIYDVPGFDSPTQIHKEQTVEFMRKADAIVLVAFAPKPSFTGPVVDMFRNNSDFDGVSFGEKMFVFANAADGAENLEENLDEIKKDLQKYNMMKSNFHRIVPGSAAAHLINAGKMQPNKHTKSAVGYTEDGIQKIKDLLENYNQTERFEILKRRINQKQNEILDVFGDLFTDNNVSPATGYLQNYGKLLGDVTDKRTVITEKLEAYRAELREEYNTKKEISKEVKDKVISEITAQNFAVNDEEKNWAKNKASKQVTLIDLTSKIDELLREKKSREIYSKFSEGILELADAHHKKFDEKVLDIFDQTLGISKGSEADKVVSQFLKNQKHSFDGQGYYQSLIDRFSVDLFNILIDIPFSDMKRYTRFESDFENFCALAMFDDRKSKTNSGNNQPLYYSILFHQTDRYEKNGTINNILDSIKTVLSFVPTPTIIKLVENIVFSGKGVEKIEGIIKAIGNNLNRQNQTPEQKQKLSETNLVTKLKEVAGQNAFFEGNITEKSYEDFFHGKLNKTIDDVKAEIEKDIDILHDALNDVVIKAINIEKAYLALEFRNIEKLLSALSPESKVWSDFVNNNLQVINASEYNNLEAEQERQMSRQNILKDIKNILDQMNNVTTSNTEK